MVDFTQRVLKGAGIIFGTSLISSAFAYLIRLILARKLTPEEFGLFFAVYSFVLIVGWIKSLGLPSSIQKLVPEFRIKNEITSIKFVMFFSFLFNLMTSLIVLVIVFFIPDSLINSYFKSILGKSIFLVMICYILMDGLSQVFTSYFLAVNKVWKYAMREMVIRGFVLIGILLISLDVFRVSWIYVLAATFSSVINFTLFLVDFKFFSHPLIFSKAVIKEIFRFSLPLTIRDFFGVLMSYVDTLTLVYFRPLVEVAIYNVILPTADLLLVLARPFGRVMLPMSSELSVSGQNERILHLLKLIHKYLFLLLVPIYTIIFTFSGWILKSLFGVQYETGSLGLKLLGLGFFFSGLSIVNYSVLIGIGRPKEATKVTLLVNALNLILNLILIPFFGAFEKGYLGAIVSTITCSFLLFLLLCYYLRRFIDYHLPLKELVIVGSIGLFMLALGYLINNISFMINCPPYLKAIIFGFSILFIYLPLLFVFGISSLREVLNIIGLFFKRKEKYGD
ncbi:MAG: oligosaccharide flippase family protein [Nanoarchaeota archaeon]